MKLPSRFGRSITGPRSFCLVVLLLIGCSEPGIPRAPIQGQVTVAGKPLAAGRILFIPVSPAEGTSTSAAIVDGRYEIAEQDGPVVGKNRVEVEADLGVALDDEQAIAKLGGRLPPQPIPPQFNRQSTLVAEIQADTMNTFDVAVPAVQGSRPQVYNR